MWRLLLGFHNSFEQSRIDVQKSIKSEVFLTLDMFLTINLQDYNLSRILTQNEICLYCFNKSVVFNDLLSLQ